MPPADALRCTALQPHHCRSGVAWWPWHAPCKNGVDPLLEGNFGAVQATAGASQMPSSFPRRAAARLKTSGKCSRVQAKPTHFPEP
jgi:hypothetical protein